MNWGLFLYEGRLTSLISACSELYERVSIIVTTNLQFADWHTMFGEEKMTAALLDRVTHRAHVSCSFFGESYRFRERLQQEEQETVAKK